MNVPEFELANARDDRCSTDLQVSVLSGGLSVPSARLRVHQLVPYLIERNVYVELLNARSSSYPPPAGAVARVQWGIGELSRRATQAAHLRCRRPDVVVVQRELISTVSTFERFLPPPLVFDVDDAIWMHRGGRAANAIAQRAVMVTCGNEYIAEYFASIAPTVVIPTAVSLDYYRSGPRAKPAARLSIGWCGQSSGHHYLSIIADAVRAILSRNPSVYFEVMSDRRPEIDLPEGRYIFRQWSLEEEPLFLQRMAVGVMPLLDGPWERGKCSYKLLSYLASSLPVVVSPVGMNNTVLREADVGYGPTNTDEWIEALDRLLQDAPLRYTLGTNGRALVEQKYALDPVADRLATALRRASGRC